VENNWGRAANIQFAGWNVCAKQPNDSDPARTVLIHFSDDDGGRGPHADYGYFTDRRTFVRLRNIEDYTDKTQFDGDVLHEFGHALGFGHEQDHPQRGTQAAGVCDPAVTVTAQALTPFDQFSVMGYCSTALNTLSPLDIVGAQNAYGRKPAGTLVGLGNRCLDIPNASTAIGTPLQVFTCNGTPNQVWTYASDATLSANVSGQQRCIEVPNSALSPNSGTLLKRTFAMLATISCLVSRICSCAGMATIASTCLQRTMRPVSSYNCRAAMAAAISSGVSLMAGQSNRA
jgi:hypothetical protein